MKNNKAAINLGISTIVVLVIAMVLIASGIAFIRGFFQQGEEKLSGAFNVDEFGLEPTRTRPLVLSEGKITIKSGEQKLVRVGFYNTDTTVEDVSISFGECASTVAGYDGIAPRLTTLSQTVQPGDTAGYETYVTAEKNDATAAKLLPGNYVCQLKANNANGNPLAEAQITIDVYQ